MRTRNLVSAILFVLVVAGSGAQQSEHFALLPAHEVKTVPKMFLKKMTRKITGTWQPTNLDLASLEEDLPKVSQMTIDGWPTSIRIVHPDLYLRQYVAVIADGRKEIFINALCAEVQPPPDWHNRLAIYYDGATCFWRAFYDPVTGQFSDLDINARA